MTERECFELLKKEVDEYNKWERESARRNEWKPSFLPEILAVTRVREATIIHIEESTKTTIKADVIYRPYRATKKRHTRLDPAREGPVTITLFEHPVDGKDILIDFEGTRWRYES